MAAASSTAERVPLLTENLLVGSRLQDWGCCRARPRIRLMAAGDQPRRMIGLCIDFPESTDELGRDDGSRCGRGTVRSEGI